MKLIINAEDLGLSQSINKGIFEGLKEGFITSASMFMNAKYTLDALEQVKKQGLKNVGVHLNITHGTPLCENVPSLIEKDGNFRYMCSMPFFARYEDVKKELDLQIQKFYDYGVTPSHLDFHHYFYSAPEVYRAYLELAEKYQLPVRSMTAHTVNLAREKGLKTTDLYIDEFHENHGNFDVLKQIAHELKDKNITAELMSTAGYIDEYTISQTNYLARESELSALKEALKENVWKDVELIDFTKLK